MPNYRRRYRAGATYFFSMVTYRRRPLFDTSDNIDRLRAAFRQTIDERPFEVAAAVVLPDHTHQMWKLPDGDADFSRRAGRAKALFTKSLPDHGPSAVPSRARHRESDVWQRRFWEHQIRDPPDFKAHLDYVHYNPVKHGYVTCPHLWPWSSFRKWVALGQYTADWLCVCDGRQIILPEFPTIEEDFGE